jgi:hypothetical protein
MLSLRRRALGHTAARAASVFRLAVPSNLSSACSIVPFYVKFKRVSFQILAESDLCRFMASHGNSLSLSGWLVTMAVPDSLKDDVTPVAVPSSATRMMLGASPFWRGLE